MTDMETLVTELKGRVAWQKTPQPLDDSSYQRLIVTGIRDLYIKTQRASSFQESKFTRDEQDEELIVSFADTLLADEVEYVLLSAQISFFQLVQTDVNNIVGYSSDALSVTNADKPYLYLSSTIKDLKSERRAVLMKMLRFGVVFQGG